MAWSEEGWRKERELGRRWKLYLDRWCTDFLLQIEVDRELGRMVPDPPSILACVRNVRSSKRPENWEG